MTFTTKTARVALAYWQRRLRLQDWNISVFVSRQRDMPQPDDFNCGVAVWSRIYRQADIHLLDPVDFKDDDAERERDMEDTLVHELLHLVLRDCRIRSKDNDDNLTQDGVAEERAVDALAAALVGLKRKGKT